MERIFCLVLGYVFGLFQTGYIYGRLNKIDIRKYGSGNAGTTNALRVLGKKAGIIVYAGDVLKTVFACLIVRLIFTSSKPEMLYVYLIYTGLGVVLGHIFPFYLKFRGGKGIAAMSALIISLDWRITLCCLCIFVATVVFTKYVSLGSILVSVCFFIEFTVFANINNFDWFNFKVYDQFAKRGSMIEASVVCFVICAVAIFKHKANIVRLINGTENKIGSSKDKAA